MSTPPQRSSADAVWHLDPRASTLWADVEHARLTVVINDHEQTGEDSEPGTGLAEWADHRATLQLAHTAEWVAWTSHNDKNMTQVAFAEFLEERIRDVIEPAGAALLEVSRTLQATTSANFKQATSTHSGETTLVWEENVTATAGRTGKADVPREFRLGLVPFVGGNVVAVDGLFRYRVRDGRLELGYRLLNVQDVLRAAVLDLVDFVAQALGLSPIEGEAPSARR